MKPLTKTFFLAIHYEGYKQGKNMILCTELVHIDCIAPGIILELQICQQ